ncbi:MAG: hypothetical protein H0T76_13110 [Nannocystis sp.]|nr:hypothetical protein [Nannocystis sp.]MBA3547419.1 hypothetical protein [Nannocystis sp.]
MFDSECEEFIKAIFSEDPVAALEAHIDERSKMDEEHRAEAIAAIGSEVRARLQLRRDGAKSPMPSNQDVWKALTTFANACKDTSNQGKRRLLFNAAFNSLTLEFYEEDLGALLWPIVNSLDYGDLSILRQSIEIYDHRQAVLRAEEASGAGLTPRGDVDLLWESAAPKGDWGTNTVQAVRAKKLADHALVVAEAVYKGGVRAIPTELGRRVDTFVSVNILKDPRYVVAELGSAT